MTHIPLPRRPAVRPNRARFVTLARVALASVLVAALAACDARGSLTSPTTGYSGTSRSDPPSGNGVDPALAGVWQQKLWFTDAQGRSFLSETTWSFRGDGTATRFVAVIAFDDGVSQEFVSHARWSARNTSLVIEWLPPRIGTTYLYYQVSGRTARIGTGVYSRID